MVRVSLQKAVNKLSFNHWAILVSHFSTSFFVFVLFKWAYYSGTGLVREVFQSKKRGRRKAVLKKIWCSVDRGMTPAVFGFIN